VVRGELTGTTYIFKSAMAAVDTYFKNNVPVDDSPNGFPENATRVQSDEGMATYVMSVEGSLGFSCFQEAHRLSMYYTEIVISSSGNKTYTATVSSESIALAAETNGLHFGNNGQPPDRLTMDITPILNVNTWPISTYYYFMVRKNNYSANANCNTMKNTVEVYDYLQENPLMLNIVGYAPLPKNVRDIVQKKLHDDVLCSDKRVWVDPKPRPPVQIFAPYVTWDIIKTYDILGNLEENLSPIYSIPLTAKEMITKITHPLDPSSVSLLVTDENMSQALRNLPESENLAFIPFIGVGIGFIYNLCFPGDELCYADKYQIQLTLLTAAKILDGIIQFWDDPDIVKDNKNITISHIRIKVVDVSYNSMHDWLKIKLQNIAKNDFQFRAKAFYTAMSFPAQEAFIRSTQGSFGFRPLNISASNFQSKIATVQSLSGKAYTFVSPNANTIEKCLENTFNKELFRYTMEDQESEDCYPLSMAYDIVFMKTVKNVANDIESGSGDADKIISDVCKSEKIFGSFLRKMLGPLAPFRENLIGSLKTGSIKNGKGVDMQNHIRRTIEKITCDGEFIIAKIQNLNLIPEPVWIFVFTLSSICVSFFAGLFIWVAKHRTRKLVRNSSPAFMFQVLIGSAIQIATVIPLASQDSYLQGQAMTPDEIVSDPYLDQACITQPILFSIGFFMVFSALFLKSWRLIRLFNNKKLKNLYVTDSTLLGFQFGIMVIVVILNLLWVLIDPLVWLRVPIFIDSDTGLMMSSKGLCFCKKGLVSALPLFLGFLLVLVVGNYLAYLGRRIPTEFNESKWTAMAMVVNLQAFGLGVPVLVLAYDQPTAGFMIKSLICIMTATATVSLVFIPKLMLAYGWFDLNGESDPWRFVKAGSSNSNKNSAGDKNSSKLTKNDESKMVVNTTNTNTNLKSNVQKSDKKMPSLSSLIDTGFSGSMSNIKLLSKTERAGSSSRNSVSSSTTNRSPGTKSIQLKQILDDETTKKQFRKFLQSIKADESLRFWDAIGAFQKESEEKRSMSARSIIMAFVLDTAAKQVNLKSLTRSKLLDVYRKSDKTELSNIDLFTEASSELFDDLKQSDSFQQFIENGNRGTISNLDEKSDISLS
jgi:ABC-type phosphate transport system substrate-binding protein